MELGEGLDFHLTAGDPAGECQLSPTAWESELLVVPGSPRSLCRLPRGYSTVLVPSGRAHSSCSPWHHQVLESGAMA